VMRGCGSIDRTDLQAPDLEAAEVALHLLRIAVAGIDEVGVALPLVCIMRSPPD
jgi:hypothetical protein